AASTGLHRNTEAAHFAAYLLGILEFLDLDHRCRREGEVDISISRTRHYLPPRQSKVRMISTFVVVRTTRIEGLPLRTADKRLMRIEGLPLRPADKKRTANSLLNNPPSV